VSVKEKNLRRNLFWLVFARVVLGTALLSAALLAELFAPGTFPADPFFVLIACTYALSIFNLATLRIAEQRRWLIDLQLVADAAIVSGFIFVTGGVASVFSFLYVLPIIAASMVQFRRGGLMVAGFSGVVYVGLVLGQYLSQAGLVPGFWGQFSRLLPPVTVGAYITGIHITGLFMVAFLSGSLTERLRSAGDRLERASHEIADWQAFNQHVIDSLTSGLATTDKSGVVVTFNRAAEQITGWVAGEAVGRRIADVLQLPSPMVDALKSDLADSSTRRADFNFARRDGRRIDIGVSLTHLVTPGGRAGYLVTFQDVTALRRLERDGRLRQRLAAVGEMAAGIAHEIRNPLASMSGSIQILRQELPLTDDQAQLMDIVLRESERLNETIRSFLAYAKPQRFSVSRLDVTKTVNDTALLLRNSAELGEGHRIEVDTPRSPLWFEADEGQLRQIFWNLATNGLRAMTGGGCLTLVARPETVASVPVPAGGDDDEGVILEVIDEGVGIAGEEIDGIFQPFHGTFSRGTGLGLSIVHRIVTDYNGTIQVRSQPGAGTTVTVRLPARVAAQVARS
jgi:two-component system sensor histidine kinase PilS (NtrC family)